MQQEVENNQRTKIDKKSVNRKKIRILMNQWKKVMIVLMIKIII